MPLALALVFRFEVEFCRFCVVCVGFTFELGIEEELDVDAVVDVVALPGPDAPPLGFGFEVEDEVEAGVETKAGALL